MRNRRQTAQKLLISWRNNVRQKMEGGGGVGRYQTSQSPAAGP